MLIALLLLIVVAVIVFNATTYVAGALIGIAILIIAALIRRHRAKKS